MGDDRRNDGIALRLVEQWELPRNFESFLAYALGGG